MKTFKYSLIRITPNLEKGETINVGLIVYNDADIDVRMLNSVSKLKAIDKCLNLNYLKEVRQSFVDLSRSIGDITMLPKLFKGALTISDFGAVTIQPTENYDKKISDLMDRLVNVQRSAHNKIKRKVFFDIKKTFVQQGVFSKSNEDLYHHKVVSNYPISADEGLSADFLLKNGKYHLTETIDFRSENIKKQMGEAALSALTISKAIEVFQNNVDSFVIYAAETTAQEKGARHQLNLLEKHTDRLINIFSKEDMDRYYEQMLNASSSIIQ
ncbi:DUF3037 domain-containing protein [Salmonella enterica subsp. enterica serovar Florida]|nr:DUF3037 domain-containing protein [Salmonella enterica subsp. enterica serovar Florida]EIP3426223.1 DUF3037 domain-containing protein [Salmonella enterica]EJP5182632.1 DUF3037 domain-containing protein [Salmonella enterica]